MNPLKCLFRTAIAESALEKIVLWNNASFELHILEFVHSVPPICFILFVMQQICGSNPMKEHIFYRGLAETLYISNNNHFMNICEDFAKDGCFSMKIVYI